LARGGRRIAGPARIHRRGAAWFRHVQPGMVRQPVAAPTRRAHRQSVRADGLAESLGGQRPLRRTPYAMRHALILALVLVISACTATPEPPQRIATAGRLDRSAVAFPATGALFGAWVKPATFTQEGRIGAVGAFEDRLGRKLDIVNT